MMPDVKLQSCSLCHQAFEGIGPSDGLCGDKCRKGKREIGHLVDTLSNFKKDPEDSRVFFYDVGFGKLADLYTVFMLRYIYSETLALAKENVIQLDKLEFSLRSKLNRCSLLKAITDRICNKILDLYHINAEMWRLRATRAQAGDIRSVEYWELSDDRDVLRAELDRLIEGRVKVTRI